jgi:hypothetical protein
VDARTQVELLWDEGRTERWIRFGHPADEQIIDRWTGNAFGTQLSRTDILRAPQPYEAFTSVSFLRPGGEVLLRMSGWPKVQRALQLIDAIEQTGFDPAEICPDHWRHIHNRLSASQEPRVYTQARHALWLKRRALSL